MQTIELNVEGMSCEMCVGHVTRALQEIDGVQSARVSLEDNAALVDYNPAQASVDAMLEAVADEGYQASVRA